MNVKPGKKARVVFPRSGVVGGAENSGIVVMVDRLAAPGEECNCNVRGDMGPVWNVTSLERPFVLYAMLESGDGRYRVFKPTGSSHNVTIPDAFLVPIKDDDEEDKIVDAIIHDEPSYVS